MNLLDVIGWVLMGAVLTNWDRIFSVGDHREERYNSICSSCMYKHTTSFMDDCSGVEVKNYSCSKDHELIYQCESGCRDYRSR